MVAIACAAAIETVETDVKAGRVILGKWLETGIEVEKQMWSRHTHYGIKTSGAVFSVHRLCWARRMKLRRVGMLT